MIDSDFTLVLENPTWVQVLQAYYLAQQDAGAPGAADAPAEETTSEADGEATEDADAEEGGKHRRGARWLSRIHQVDGVERSELSKIHGRLIAYGFLKCDLADKTAEVVYQLTLAGKQVLGLAEKKTQPDQAAA